MNCKKGQHFMRRDDEGVWRCGVEGCTHAFSNRVTVGHKVGCKSPLPASPSAPVLMLGER